MRTLKIIGLLIFILTQTSCSKEEDNNPTLAGIYTETLPSPGTHQLHFIDHETVIFKARNSTDEEFIYELAENKIKLIPTRDLSQTWELEINFITPSKFEITNIFYASIPEDNDPLRFVTFEK